MPNPETDYRPATAERQAEMNVLPKEKQAQILNALTVSLLLGNFLAADERFVDSLV